MALKRNIWALKEKSNRLYSYIYIALILYDNWIKLTILNLIDKNTLDICILAPK